MRYSKSGAVVLLSAVHFVNVIANPKALLDLDQNMMLARAPEPTAAPLLRYARDRVFARQTQNAQTCGFLDQDPDNALYCGTGYGCAYFTATDIDQPEYFECCQTYSTGGIEFNSATCFEVATCVDFSSHSLTFTFATSYQTSGIGTEYCGSTAPYCGVTYLTASEEVTGFFTHYNCEAGPSVTSTAWDVAVGAVTSSGSTTVPSTSPTPGSSGSSTSTPTTSPAPTTATPTPTHTSEPSKSNTGAIAGGVVGGVGAVAIIGGLIGWLMWKKRRDRREADIPEVSVLPSK